MTDAIKDAQKERYYAAMRAVVETALKEDVGPGDLTSLAALEPDTATGKIVARSNGVISGTEPASLVFDIVDSANRIDFKLKDGDSFKNGDIIAGLSGFNLTLLTSERVALNFLGHLSGIASRTALFVEKIARHNCLIRDTRKMTPGMRLLEKAAVVHGGGLNHRLGLYDMILIKENHIRSAGSIGKAVDRAREYMTTPDFRMQFKIDATDIKIEVEISTETELREAHEAKADRILLDNQSIESLQSLVRLSRSINSKIVLEASGNVTLETVEQVAATSVDEISIGSITHSAPCSDFSMLLDPA